MAAAIEMRAGRQRGEVGFAESLTISHLAKAMLGLKPGFSTGSSPVFGYMTATVEAGNGYSRLQVKRQTLRDLRIVTDIEVEASDCDESGALLVTRLNARRNIVGDTKALRHVEYCADRWPDANSLPLFVIVNTLHVVQRLQQSNLIEIGSA